MPASRITSLSIDGAGEAEGFADTAGLCDGVLAAVADEETTAAVANEAEADGDSVAVGLFTGADAPCDALGEGVPPLSALGTLLHDAHVSANRRASAAVRIFFNS